MTPKPTLTLRGGDQTRQAVLGKPFNFGAGVTGLKDTDQLAAYSVSPSGNRKEIDSNLQNGVLCF